MADGDTGMSRGEMKKLLMKSKDEPVSAAFALGPDPTVGLLMLDKIKQPRALGKILEKQFPDAKNSRFGTAMVDADADPKLVRFFVNRQVSGMARKLAKTLKGTGFSKVEILLDDETAVDSYSGDEDEAPAAPPASPPASPNPAQDAPPDAASLHRTLSGLVPRVAGAAPDTKAALVKLATEAGAALKSQDLAAAAQAIEALGRALEAAPSPPPPATPDPSRQLAALIARVAAIEEPDRKAALAEMAKAANAQLKAGDAEATHRTIEALRTGLDAEPGPNPGAAFPKLWNGAVKRWQDASDTVGEQIGKLQGALKATGDDELHDIAEFGLNGITGGTRVKLMAAIHDIGSPAGPVPAGKIGAAAKAVAAFRQQIAGDSRVEACDGNPFGVEVAIRGTFLPALAGLENALKSATTGG